MSYPADFVREFTLAESGLTLKAAVRNIDGSLQSKDLTGIVELVDSGGGTGIYIWHASLADGQRGSVVFYVGTIGAGTDFTGVSVKAVYALDPPIENSDAKTSTRATPTNITAASGVVLAATGLDQLSPALPAGVPSTYAQWQMASSRVWLNGGIYPVNGVGTITLNEDDGTPWLAQSITTDAMHQTRGRIQ